MCNRAKCHFSLLRVSFIPSSLLQRSLPYLCAPFDSTAHNRYPSAVSSIIQLCWLYALEIALRVVRCSGAVVRSDDHAVSRPPRRDGAGVGPRCQWRTPEHFCNILVTGSMFSDQLPDLVNDSLRRLAAQQDC